MEELKKKSTTIEKRQKKIVFLQKQSKLENEFTTWM